MKNKVLILIIILFALIILSFNNKNDYKFIKNQNNLIIYNNSIDKGILNQIINSYKNFVNNFINNNKLSNIKIEEQEILFVFVKNGVDEVGNIDQKLLKKINKIRKNKYKIDFSSIIYDLTIKDKKRYLRGVYLPLQDVIIINFLPYKEVTYPELPVDSLILGEYSHYILSKNLEKNFGDIYLNYFINQRFNNELHKIKYLFDESLTHFLSHFNEIILKEFNEIKEIKNYHINENNFSVYDDFYKLIKKSFIQVKPLNEFFMGALNTENLLIYYLSLFIYIKKNYGLEKIDEFIHFLYNGDFSSVDKITRNIFDKDELSFYNEWSEFTLQNQ